MSVRLPSSLVAVASLALLPIACRGYYPTWHYAPNAEIHQLHVPSEDGKESPATVAVAASIVGILRPDGGAPRRLHTHFEIDNRGQTRATFDPSKVRATPSGASALEPEPGSVLELAPGEQRSAEVYFRIPHPSELPNASLVEIELSWSVGVDDRELSSRAKFRRASVWRDDPYYWHDPYWYGHPYYGRGYYGYPWYFHGGFAYYHCD